MSNSKEYYVGVTILNCYTVTANSEEEAEEKVRSLDEHATLNECELTINYVDEVAS